MRSFVLVLVVVFAALVVIAGVVSPRAARAATIATDAPTQASAQMTTADSEAEAPRDIVLGRFLYESYFVRTPDEQHLGGRFGVDMVGVNGDDATKIGGGLRFTLGGDGAAAFGTEGQLLTGVVRTIRDRAAVGIFVPLGFTLGGGASDFAAHGYVGIQGIAAIGRFADDQGPSIRGVEIAAELSNRGARARAGIVRPGKEIGFGFGVDWQRDGDNELLGVYFATTAGR